MRTFLPRRGMTMAFAVLIAAFTLHVKPAAAQSNVTQSVAACNVKASTTLLGLFGQPIFTLPLACVNQSAVSAPGTDQHTFGNLPITVPGTNTAISLAFGSTSASESFGTGTTTTTGQASSNSINIPGIFSADSLSEQSTCTSSNTGTPNVNCNSTAQFTQFVLGNQLFTVPVPIPANTSIAGPSIPLPIVIAGIPLGTVNFNSKAVLNEILTPGNNTPSAQLQSSATHVQLNGTLNAVLGLLTIGGVQIDLWINETTHSFALPAGTVSEQD